MKAMTRTTKRSVPQRGTPDIRRNPQKALRPGRLIPLPPTSPVPTTAYRP